MIQKTLKRKNLYKKTSPLGYIIDSEINDESTNDKIYTKIGIDSYINNISTCDTAKNLMCW